MINQGGYTLNPHIELLLSETWSQIESLYLKEKERIDAFKSYHSLQAGLRDYLKVGYRKGTASYKQGSFFVEIEEPFSWSDSAYTWESEVSIDELSATLLQEEYAPALQQRLYTLFMSDEYGSHFFDYRFELWFEFENEQAEQLYIHNEQWINTSKLTTLQQALDHFITDKVTSDLPVLPKEKDLFFFAKLMLNKDIIPTDVERVSSLFEQLDLKLFNFRSLYSDWQSTSTMALRFWANEIFLPTYFDAESEYNTTLHLKSAESLPAVDEKELALFIYAALRIGKQDAEQRKTYLEYAVQLHSEQAQRYLRQGSGTIESERKTDLFHGKANDILQMIQIKLTAEDEPHYREALTYICDLLRADFPREYVLKFSSKQKNFLPVKGLAKSALHRFFANALQYKELHPLIAEYGELALQEFAWYNDVEAGEKSVMPGTYAILGLGLYSTDYSPLLIRYMKLVDTEHQSAQDHYPAALVEAHGMDASFVPTLMSVLLASSESAKPIKGWGDVLEKDEIILAWDTQLQSLEDYQRDQVLYLLCGNSAKQKAFMQKAKRLRSSTHS